MTADDKVQLRKRCRALRDAMTAEVVATASARVCDHLASWTVFQHTRTVMAYMAFRGEINLMPLIERFHDKRWVIPRIIAKPEPQLIVHPYDPARLVRHRYGMLQPDASLPVIEPCKLDLVLVPGVTFDRRGYRLGYGGGFYDRFLPHVTATKVGIVYAALIVDSMPNDEFDQGVDFLVSEAGILAAPRRPGA